MGIKTYQEKNTKPMEKTRVQSDIPVKRKIPKTIQKYNIPGDACVVPQIFNGGTMGY